MSATRIAVGVGITVGAELLVAAAIGIGVGAGVGGVSTFAGLHAARSNAANMTVTRPIDRGSFGRCNIVTSLSVVIWSL
jgi:hypothetical protein